MSPKRQATSITMTSYVAFLRGINNIGHKTVKMAELQHVFEAIGFQNVKTIMASGNIVFDSVRPESAHLRSEIENVLENKLGYPVYVVLRLLDELRLLVLSNPFSQIKITPRTKFILTFLSEKPIHRLTLPYKSPERDFTILRITGGEIYSEVTLLPGIRPYRIIGFLEKEFGKKITTRNWNTILKIVKRTDPV